MTDDIASLTKRHVNAKQAAERVKIAYRKSQQYHASQCALLERQKGAVVSYETRIGRLEEQIKSTKKKIPQTELLVEEARAERDALKEELNRLLKEEAEAKAARKARREEELQKRKAASAQRKAEAQQEVDAA